ncbi:hypothetical protein NLG42_00300 [Flavobacterium plurextorum]|uniref:hypothetical protein n=1 Tax=Flavobacterium TaxID=237 RepID=UPI00214D627C|nr:MULTISPECIES: hypothetical protein [Flavobacterium]UUW09267.1 hypothetical protein NLG42_00300 [Flavobacterium plurextorum]
MKNLDLVQIHPVFCIKRKKLENLDFQAFTFLSDLHDTEFNPLVRRFESFEYNINVIISRWELLLKPSV